jgi:hypothetical protein
MTTLETRVRDLIHFYIKINYETYLKEHQIQQIPGDRVESVIKSLYDDRKEHLKEFLKQSLRKLLEDDYPGDLVVLNLITEVFADDDLCRNRLVMEIHLHQQKLRGERNNYRTI